MKFKRFFYIGLFLAGGLFGCKTARQPHVHAFLERLQPPTADQVRKWAGLSENSPLTMFTNVPEFLGYDSYPGEPQQGFISKKFKWLWAYKEGKGTNFNCFVIAVYDPGALLTTNRSKFFHDNEFLHKMFLERAAQIKNNLAEHKPASKADLKTFDDWAKATATLVMPNGQKSYGYFLAFPERFALHPEFDVIAYWFPEPLTYDKSHPPPEIEFPTNSLYEFFTNVDSFIASQ